MADTKVVVSLDTGDAAGGGMNGGTLDRGIQQYLRSLTSGERSHLVRDGWEPEIIDEKQRNDRARLTASFYEFFGSLVLTYVSSAAVLSSGTLSIKYDLVELTSARIFCCATAAAFIYAALLFPVVGLRVHTKSKSNPANPAHAVIYHYPFSSGHFNPATTLACYILDQIDKQTVLFYVIAQFTGAMLGALMLWLTWFSVAPATSLGSTVVNSDAGPWMGLSMEFSMSFFFHFVLLSLFKTDGGRRKKINTVTDMIKYSNSGVQVLYVCFVFLVALVIATGVSGGSLNPARSIAPALCSGTWQDHWIYWVGPFLGASAAAFMLKEDKKK